MRYLTDECFKKDGRLFFEDPEDRDNVAVFYVNRNGEFTVSVAEEQAVDSYNDTFECTFHLMADQAKKVRDLLNETWPPEQKAPAVNQGDEGSKSSDDVTP